MGIHQFAKEQDLGHCHGRSQMGIRCCLSAPVEFNVSGPWDGFLEDSHWPSQARDRAETSWIAPRSWEG